MQYRTLGKTRYKVSEIGFGSWAIGADWGKVSKNNAIKALEKAIDMGVNFIDTADVYGDGRSEKIIQDALSSLPNNKKNKILVATKAGRRLNPHIASGYTAKNIESYINRSLKNLRVESLDLLQLHCPPTEIYYNPELFVGMDNLVKKGKIRFYGVSVEKIEEGIKAINYTGVSTVQIIFNIFRQRPKELFFKLAKEHNIGVIVRVPLASGLLTGKMSLDSKFAKSDHRNFNRNGEAFDKGETFAGVPFDIGLKAVEELKEIKPEGISMVDFALRWILDHEQVSVVIPGAKNAIQAQQNTKASELNQLSPKTTEEVRKVYDKYIKEYTHERW